MGYCWPGGYVQAAAACPCSPPAPTSPSLTPLADTDYDRLRPLSYTDTSVVLIAFSVVRPDTLKNVHLKWKDEVQHFCPSAPILLIGTKSDLRESSTEPTVSPEEAKAAAAAIGAASYIECSALSDVNVNTVFQTAARAALEGVERAPSKRKCSLL